MSNKNVKRSRTLATQGYKAVNGITLNYIQELFEVKEIPYNLGDPSRTIIPQSNTTTYGLKSFKHEGNKIWNWSLVDIKTSESLAIFNKNKMTTKVLNIMPFFNCFYPLYI